MNKYESEALANKIRDQKLTGKILCLYDMGQTLACEIMRECEGIAEERHDAIAHRYAIETVALWLKAARVHLFGDPTDTWAIVDLAYTLLN